MGIEQARPVKITHPADRSGPDLLQEKNSATPVNKIINSNSRASHTLVFRKNRPHTQRDSDSDTHPEDRILEKESVLMILPSTSMERKVGAHGCQTQKHSMTHTHLAVASIHTDEAPAKETNLLLYRNVM